MRILEKKSLLQDDGSQENVGRDFTENDLMRIESENKNQRTLEYIENLQNVKDTEDDKNNIILLDSYDKILKLYAKGNDSNNDTKKLSLTHCKQDDGKNFPVYLNSTTGEYKCITCEKKFPKRRMLYRHWASHYDFVCPICGKFFLYEKDREKHYQEAKHEQRPCKKCNDQSLSLNKRIAHYIRAHASFARP